MRDPPSHKATARQVSRSPRRVRSQDERNPLRCGGQTILIDGVARDVPCGKADNNLLDYALGEDMRKLIVLLILLFAVGCSTQPPTKHYILPVDFSGVFKVEKVPGHSEGYKIDGTRYIFTIPESGVLSVAPEVFINVCRPCNELTASFVNGQEISHYNPLTSQPDSRFDAPMLLGILGSNEVIWYAVGTHEQLSRFLDKVKREKYQKLERYLPPNMPFQIQSDVSKEESSNS